MRLLVVDAHTSSEPLAHVRTLVAEYAAMPHTAGRWLTVDEDLAQLPHPFVAPQGVLLLALDGDEPVGCGALRAFSAEIGEIKRMYVRPTARGRGVGAQLLDALLAHAARIGYTRVRLDTAPTLHSALALYARAGFTAIPPYRDDLLPDALCFERVVPAAPASE